MDLRIVHIAAGVVALIAGFIALFARKGSRVHRRGGLVFVVAMLVMTGTAVPIAAFERPNLVNIDAGLLTFYFASTGMLTVRPPAMHAQGVAVALVLIAITGTVLAFDVALTALHSTRGIIDGVPAPPLLMFATMGVFGVLGDLRALWWGAASGKARLVRHVWRIGFAMFVATTSAFLGQSRVVPEPLRKTAFLVIPVLLVLGVVLYWFVRLQWQRLRARGGRAAIATPLPGARA
jgi:hypothetical protein